MSTSLSSLADNLSEIKTDKNCKSSCNFIRLKNNRLRYKCKECGKEQLEPK